LFNSMALGGWKEIIVRYWVGFLFFFSGVATGA